MQKQIVRPIELKNKEILSHLSQISDLILDLNKNVKLKKPWSQEAKNFISEKYCDDIMAEGSMHKGFPEKDYMIPMGGDVDGQVEALLDDSPYYKDHIATKLTEANKNIQLFLGAAHCALFSFYPAEGFIGWHNNANAPGYNVIFTWSETGEGFFQYRDENNTTVKVNDSKGWSAKLCRFPSYTEAPLYHSAYTKCRRFTCAYRFEEQDNIWENLCMDLMDE